MKIDPYNFELYRFKVGAFFLRQRLCICHTSATAWGLVKTVGCNQPTTHCRWHNNATDINEL